MATWHTKDRMVGGTRLLFRATSSTEASPSLGSGQITKGLTESQRPVPDIMSQRRSPRVKRNAAVTSLFNVVKVCRLQGLSYLRQIVLCGDTHVRSPVCMPVCKERMLERLGPRRGQGGENGRARGGERGGGGEARAWTRARKRLQSWPR